MLWPKSLLLVVLLSHCLVAKEVAITIDDLPRDGNAAGKLASDRDMTVKLLAPFGQGHIPVVGFVNECQHSDELLTLLPLWVSAGAELGNHTCSHVDLNRTSVADFETEITKGAVVTTDLLGHKPKYFRYPFLHTGKDEETKRAVQQFLRKNGYRTAPVTLDNSDYMFARVYANALAAGDSSKATQVRKTYLAYLQSIFAFFEARSVEVTGHEIRQILLIHASQLNADAMPDLLSMMRRRGYTLVSLDRALQDPAYFLPENYVGPRGLSSIHRWSVTKGMKPRREPDEPAWIRKQAGF